MSTNANGNRAEYNSITLLGQYQSAAMTRRKRLGSKYSLGTQTAVKEDSNPKKLASSSSTRAERRLTSPLEKSPKALRNLSWNLRKKKLKLLAR